MKREKEEKQKKKIKKMNVSYKSINYIQLRKKRIYFITTCRL